ncbi:MAG: hypothetical protein II759_02155 [Lachnospiraceae bacterium]|nr:hypothetical protein [Lachnospiraceae bacterium]
MNYDHIQLNPAVNRVRIDRDKSGPAAPERTAHQIVQPDANPADPYRNTHLGWFSDVITDEHGQERKYGFYIPTTMKTSGNMVLVLIPGGADPEEFFRDGGWKESLEKHCMTGYFASSPAPRDPEDMGAEIDAAVKVLAEMKSMEYFPCNASAVYAMGFGDGAPVASVFAILYQSYLAAFAACGNTEIDAELLKRLGGAPSDCDVTIPRAEIPLPAYFIGEDSNVVAYFRGACHTSSSWLHNGFARVFREMPRPGSSYVNDEVASEVWLSSAEDADKLGAEVLTEKMVAFVESYQRWAGEGSGHIRRTMHAEKELGFIRTDAEIDGLKRYWYTFEPSAYRRKLQEKYPLIIAIHGFSCSGEFFAQNSGWHRVGEERRCFVVYPTAYPYTNSPSPNPSPLRMTGIATPHWNSGGFGGGPDPKGPDDVSFFKQMLDITLEKYPEIDRERIYVTGHSNGSMMTQLIMRKIPQYFAGFAPVGAMECRTGKSEPPRDGVKRNVWYTIGQYDGFGCSLDGPNGNTWTLEMICEANGIDYAKARSYVSGIYNHLIVRDEEKVPLVRFTGVTNWPHTYTPELAFMIYDEFFSRFVRHADGTLEYLA